MILVAVIDSLLQTVIQILLLYKGRVAYWYKFGQNQRVSFTLRFGANALLCDL